MPRVQGLGDVQVQTQASTRGNQISVQSNQLLPQKPSLAETTCCVQALPPR